MASKTETRAASGPVPLPALARALVAGSLPGELEGFSPADRSSAAAFVLQALSARRPGQPSIAVDTLADSGGRRHMRLAVVNDDMPFLVDSVAAVVSAHGLVIDRLLHPVLPVARDAKGALVSIGGEGARESVIYIETDRADARSRSEIRTMIGQALSDVRQAVADWAELRATMTGDADGLDGEDSALLGWLADNNFTLLGAARFDAAGAFTDGIGIARSKGEDLLSVAARKKALAVFRAGGASLIVVKSNLASTVHRRVPLDLLIVARRTGRKVSGLTNHAGLWTSAALGRSATDIPLLRARLAALQAKYRFDPQGHAGKALAQALSTLPHDVAISIAEADLERLALAAMSIADRPRPKLELVSAPLDRHVFAFVWLPRDELTTARRVAIAQMLADAAGGHLLSWAIELGDGDVAMIRYTIDVRGGALPDAAPLNDRIESMVRGWQPAVEAGLARLFDSGQAARMALRYAGAFPAGYRSGAGPDEPARALLSKRR